MESLGKTQANIELREKVRNETIDLLASLVESYLLQPGISFEENLLDLAKDLRSIKSDPDVCNHGHPWADCEACAMGRMENS